MLFWFYRTNGQVWAFSRHPPEANDYSILVATGERRTLVRWPKIQWKVDVTHDELRPFAGFLLGWVMTLDTEALRSCNVEMCDIKQKG